MNRIGEFLIDGGWKTLWACIDTSIIGLGVLALLGVIADLLRSLILC